MYLAHVRDDDILEFIAELSEQVAEIFPLDIRPYGTADGIAGIQKILDRPRSDIARCTGDEGFGRWEHYGHGLFGVRFVESAATKKNNQSSNLSEVKYK